MGVGWAMGLYEIEAGDWIVFVSGPRENWDWGQVTEVEDGQVSVNWEGAEQGTTCSSEALADGDLYLDRSIAQYVFKQAIRFAEDRNPQW